MKEIKNIFENYFGATIPNRETRIKIFETAIRNIRDVNRLSVKLVELSYLVNDELSYSINVTQNQVFRTLNAIYRSHGFVFNQKEVFRNNPEIIANKGNVEAFDKLFVFSLLNEKNQQNKFISEENAEIISAFLFEEVNVDSVNLIKLYLILNKNRNLSNNQKFDMIAQA